MNIFSRVKLNNGVEMPQPGLGVFGASDGDKVNQIPVLQKLAEKYNKTPLQIVLRQNTQKGVVTIPKSVTKERIISNADIFDFELSDEDVHKIDMPDTGTRLSLDPDLVEKEQAPFMIHF